MGSTPIDRFRILNMARAAAASKAPRHPSAGHVVRARIDLPGRLDLYDRPTRAADSQIRRTERKPTCDARLLHRAGDLVMAQVLVRNLPDDVVARLKARATRARHSLEQELRNILIDAARPGREGPRGHGSHPHDDLEGGASRFRGADP
jgi:hypothetical protein